MTCTAHHVPARIAAGAPASETVSGDLCFRGSTPPRVVQVLLAGATYNRDYWNPDDGGANSYVAAATAAGYAVFNADRVGTGSSSHPPAQTLDVTAGALAVRDVITALRTGAIDGHRFARVVLVGHSLGAAVGWRVGDAADALIVSSELHAINHPVWNSLKITPATSDRRFASYRLGEQYVTTSPGARGMFHYKVPAAVVQRDEVTKDLSTIAELTEATALVDSADPRTAPTAAMTVPVLVVIGQYDTFFCAGQCVQASVDAQERRYYPHAASLTTVVLPGVGHSLNLSPSASAMHAAMLGWLEHTTLGPRTASSR